MTDATGAEPLVPAQAEPVPVPAEPAPEAASPGSLGQHWPHRLRFLVIYGLLGLALGGAVVGFVVYTGRSISPAPAWSAWHPSGGGLGASRQIGDYVAKQYRLPSGSQLVDVITKAPSIANGKQTIPIHYVAIRAPKSIGDQTFAVSPSDSVVYSLCGLGQACAIATGTPTVARGRLVRREILEMALYTFKYVPGVQNVIAFMPPRLGTTPQYVVYLRKSDFAPELKQPLVDTLAAKTPLPNTIPAREVRLVDATTEPRLFQFKVAQSQLGDLVLVLQPLAA